MAEEQKNTKPARGMIPGHVVYDDPAFVVETMFPKKEQVKALKELNELHDRARGLLGAALPALIGIQQAVKNKVEGLDVNNALTVARQITADAEEFKKRLDTIKAKIPTEPSDQAVVSSLHIATELQQWTEDWGNVAEPMIDTVSNLLEKKDV